MCNIGLFFQRRSLSSGQSNSSELAPFSANCNERVIFPEVLCKLRNCSSLVVITVMISSDVKIPRLKRSNID
jgi:hypothetical protein